MILNRLLNNQSAGRSLRFQHSHKSIRAQRAFSLIAMAARERVVRKPICAVPRLRFDMIDVDAIRVAVGREAQ
jgi:hypothetical protein